MASYTSNSNGKETTSASSYGIAKCKWKPRKISAKRDYPRAFYEANMNTNLKGVQPPVMIAEPENISGSAYGVSQMPKRQKMSLVRDSPNRIGGYHEENLCLDKSVHGSSDTGMFDFIPLEKDCEFSGSSDPTERFDSDYDLKPHMTTEHQETDCVKFNTDDVACYKKRKMSAVRCWPPGCGRKYVHLSDEELGKEMTEKKNHWSICKNHRSDDEEEEDEDDTKTHGAASLGPYIELKFHGVCVKEIRCYQTQGELKIELSAANIQKNSIGVEHSQKNEQTHTCEQPHSTSYVSGVRCFPPGCGN